MTKIALIASAHGVRGQVKIRCLTGNPEDLLTYALTDATGKRAFKLTRHGIKDQLLIASLDGIADRNAAELLKGTALYTPASALPANAKNQWSYSELIGLEARLKTGKPYGKITAVDNFGAGDILTLIRADGSEEMLPFTGAFVGDVLSQQGFLVIFPPDYVEEI